MLTLLLVLMLSEAPAPRPLEQLKLEEILSCADDPVKCDAGEWELAGELSRRYESKDLLARFQRASEAQRRVLVFALYQEPASPKVTSLMKKLSGDRDEELAYYALNYRAKACERGALAKLTAPPYEIRAACAQWATTVSLVGQCKYTPGGAFLLSSLDHACLNVVLAAEEGLKALYPDAPASFESMTQTMEYFEKRVKQER